MIRKSIGLICVISLLFCMISCNKEKPASTPKVTENKNEVSWIIYDPESLIMQDWKQYTLLDSISAETNTQPDISVITDNIDVSVTKLLISGKFPDLVTLPLSNRNSIKFAKSLPIVSFTPETPIYQALPEKITEYHGKEELTYIPGGFQSDISAKLIADEGVYLYTQFRNDATVAFNSFDDLTEYMSKHSELTNSTCTDLLLFGKRGFETLEHLFGITPQEKYNSESLSQDNRYKSLLNLFATFGKCGVNNCRLDSFDSSRLPLIYIGESAYVKKWNAASGKCLYTHINICGNSEGFLSAASNYGKYATYVTKGENIKNTESLILKLLDSEYSEKLMLGEKNTHWLRDTSTDTYLIPDAVLEKMINGDTVLWKQFGISVFPYLSSCGAYYPYPDSPIQKKDLLNQYSELCIDPTSPKGAEYQKISSAFEEQYLFALSQNNTQ